MKKIVRTIATMGLVILFPLAAGASPVLHVVVGELTGCKNHEDVAKVVHDMNAGSAGNGGPQAYAWAPVHHDGAGNTVAVTFVAPSLNEYGKQIDGFSSSQNSGTAQKLYDCMRVVGRSADRILMGPTTVADDVTVVDRSVWTLNPQCSDGDLLSLATSFNAWANQEGLPERGVRRPLFGGAGNTVTTYGLYSSFEAYTDAMEKVNAAVEANPDSTIGKLLKKAGTCLSPVSRSSARRLQ